MRNVRGITPPSGMAELAAADRDRAAARKPTTCHDLTLAGTTLFAAGDLAGAEEALRRALQLEMTSFWTWYVLGHCHYAQRRYLEAAGDFGACAARDPSVRLGPLQPRPGPRQGRPPARCPGFLRPRARDRSAISPRPWSTGRCVELELNELERARDDLTAAIKLGRNDLVVFAALGEAWSRLGRREESERYFAALLDRDRGNLVVRVARGMTRIRNRPARRGGRLPGGARARRAKRPGALRHGAAGAEDRPEEGPRSSGPGARLQPQPDRRRAAPRSGPRAAGRTRCSGRRRPSARECDAPTGCTTPPAPSRFSRKRPPTRSCVSHAIDLLTQAPRSRLPAQEAAADPDLKPLARASPLVRAAH